MRFCQYSMARVDIAVRCFVFRSAVPGSHTTICGSSRSTKTDSRSAHESPAASKKLWRPSTSTSKQAKPTWVCKTSVVPQFIFSLLHLRLDFWQITIFGPFCSAKKYERLPQVAEREAQSEWLSKRWIEAWCSHGDTSEDERPEKGLCGWRAAERRWRGRSRSLASSDSRSDVQFLCQPSSYDNRPVVMTTV